MDLNVPITITDELADEVVVSTALLNLASGDIHRVQYQDHDPALGAPWEQEDYDFSSGVLSNNGKDVEFKVDVNRTTGQYSVSASELLEIKVRAAAHGEFDGVAEHVDQYLAQAFFVRSDDCGHLTDRQVLERQAHVARLASRFLK